MKKLLVLVFISFLPCIPQLHSISVTAYIQQQSIPQITENGILNLFNKSITDLTGLQDIPNKNQIATLNLAMNQLTALPSGIFSGFNNLQRLALFGNELTTLPAGIFNGLNNLQGLGLNNNQLVELPKGIFNNLNNLQSLRLNNNQLTMLPTDIFNGLTKLATLDLNGNPFTSSFMPQLIEILHSIPNDNVTISLFNWTNPMPKDEAIKRLIHNTAPHLLHRLPADILDLLHLTKEEREEIERQRA